MTYGIYDTQDGVWMGNDDGPLHNDDRETAQAICQMVSDMILGTDVSLRFQVRELPPDAFRLRDEIKVRHTPVESLERIEGGRG